MITVDEIGATLSALSARTDRDGLGTGRDAHRT